MTSKEKVLVGVARSLVLGEPRLMRSKHVAFVLLRGKVIAIGRNKHTCDPHRRLSIHAEIDAIRKTNLKDAYKFSLLVVRIKKSGELAMSKPCTSCQKFLSQVGVTRIRYSMEGDIIEGIL